MNHSNPSEHASSLRRVVQSVGISLTICTAIVFGGLSFYHLKIVPALTPPLPGAVTFSETLNFAGIMVTVLAFVSAFYILLLAVDAFKISSDVSKNAYSIRENHGLLENLRTRIEMEEERLALLKADASLSSDIFRELNSAADDTAEFLRLLDRSSRALELAASSQGDPNPDIVRRISEHAKAIRSKVPGLSERNTARQARISVLSQMASEPAYIDDLALKRALFILRAEADLGEEASQGILSRYRSKRAESLS